MDGVGLVDGWMTQGERRDTQGGRFVAAGLREEIGRVANFPNKMLRVILVKVKDPES